MDSHLCWRSAEKCLCYCRPTVHQQDKSRLQVRGKTGQVLFSRLFKVRSYSCYRRPLHRGDCSRSSSSSPWLDYGGVLPSTQTTHQRSHQHQHITCRDLLRGVHRHVFRVWRIWKAWRGHGLLALPPVNPRSRRPR